MRRVSPKRARQNRRYRYLNEVYLSEHTVCDLWCAEHGWKWVAPHIYQDLKGAGSAYDDALFQSLGAPASVLIHHKNKRRGERLNDTSEWMALSQAAHDRIEGNKSWARANGYLRDF